MDSYWCEPIKFYSHPAHVQNAGPLSDRTVVHGCRCYWQRLYKHFDFVFDSTQIKTNHQFPWGTSSQWSLQTHGRVQFRLYGYIFGDDIDFNLTFIKAKFWICSFEFRRLYFWLPPDSWRFVASKSASSVPWLRRSLWKCFEKRRRLYEGILLILEKVNNIYRN